MILLGAVSIFIFIFSLVSLFWAIGRLPADYFLLRFSKGSHYHRFSLTLLLIKNIAGIVVLCGGIAMLFIPGQGLLTIFMGVLMLNFPGKKKLELWFIELQKVQKGLNYLRLKRKLPLFIFPTKVKKRKSHSDGGDQ